MIPWNILRLAIATATIVAVAELSKHFPRYVALLLSLPLVSILAFARSWSQYHDLPAISKLGQRDSGIGSPGTAVFCSADVRRRIGIGVLVVDGTGNSVGDRRHGRPSRLWSAIRQFAEKKLGN
jgi:hypothetical protein